MIALENLCCYCRYPKSVVSCHLPYWRLVSGMMLSVKFTELLMSQYDFVYLELGTVCIIF